MKPLFPFRTQKFHTQSKQQIVGMLHRTMVSLFITRPPPLLKENRTGTMCGIMPNQ